jgi:hypothetical protein
MTRSGNSRLPATDGDHLLAMVILTDVLDLLTVQLNLEAAGSVDVRYPGTWQARQRTTSACLSAEVGSGLHSSRSRPRALPAACSNSMRLA